MWLNQAQKGRKFLCFSRFSMFSQSKIDYTRSKFEGEIAALEWKNDGMKEKLCCAEMKEWGNERMEGKKQRVWSMKSWVFLKLLWDTHCLARHTAERTTHHFRFFNSAQQGIMTVYIYLYYILYIIKINLKRSWCEDEKLKMVRGAWCVGAHAVALVIFTSACKCSSQAYASVPHKRT